MRREHVDERVAAELLARGARELPRDRSLGDDGQRLDRRDVAALDERLRRLAGRKVDRVERRISVGNGFIAARTTSSSPFEIPASIPPARLERRVRPGLDLVVGRRAALAGEREAVADLDPLHRLDPHQRRREPRVEPVLAGGVRAEPGKDAVRADLDDAAERVAVGPCGVDRLLPVLALAADLEHRAGDLDPELAQERLRDGAGRDEHGRMAGARPLERVAHVLVAVLQDTREVGVAGARQRHRLRALAGRLALGRPRVHPPRPVLVVAVPDDERERRSQRAPVPEAGEHLDLVLLELLARAAPVALLAPVQVGVDRGAVERRARRAARSGSPRAPARATRRRC